MKIPFIGGGYLGRSLNIDSQRCVNLYPVLDKEGGKPLTLDGTPGLSEQFNMTTEMSYSGTLYPAVSADDGMAYNNTLFNSNWNFFDIGNGSLDQYYAFIRFPSAQIDPSVPAAAFTSAFLRLTAYDTRTPNITLYIYFNDSDNAVAPTSYAGYQALYKTTAKATWSITQQWNDGTQYDSADLSSAIAEVVARPGWTKGNALMVMIEWSGTGDDLRYVSSIDYLSGAEKPELHIAYSI